MPSVRDPRSDAEQLLAVHRAALAIGGDLDLERTLRRILRMASRLVGARYGAIGVRDETGAFGIFLTVGIPRRQADLIGDLPRLHGLLGTVLRERRSVRLEDVQDHPDFSYYPAHHPVMREFLGVPIVQRGEVLGELFLSGTASGRFTAADQRLIEMLGDHAAIAIATARLAAHEAELATLRERDRVSRNVQAAVSRSLLGMIEEARLGSGQASDPGALRARLGALEKRATAALGDIRRLTAREREVLWLMASGRSNKEIAQELGLSDRTVKTHVSSVLGKLGVADRTQAAVLAVRSGLLT